jgi:ornithine cyclodeaminase/alanine dehydrogenase-like protein (mu-crystallin family)
MMNATLGLSLQERTYLGQMDPLYINKEKIASLLPMDECISVMDEMFRALANGECLQPLRSLMWLPDKSGLMGMMPGYAEGLGVMAIKVISIFRGNRDAGYPSHQGVVTLFDGQHGQPLMMFDAAELTAIRTAAASAVATRLLARADAATLAIIGSGEQAEKHIEAISLVRNISRINIWGRNEHNVHELVEKFTHTKPSIGPLAPHPIHICKTAREAVKDADIICTVTGSKLPVIAGDWIAKGAHINAIGSSTPAARELDTATILRSKIFTDRYESLFNEAGDFLIPKKEGAIDDTQVAGEIGEVLTGTKKGRSNDEEITLFKSLGIAMEDLYAAFHIYRKITARP